MDGWTDKGGKRNIIWEEKVDTEDISRPSSESVSKMRRLSSCVT